MRPYGLCGLGDWEGDLLMVVHAGSIGQTAWGDHNVQRTGVIDSQITVTYGQPPTKR